NFSDTGAGNGFRVSAGVVATSRDTSANATQQRYYNPNGQVGSVITSGTATSYNTSSDELWKDFTGVLSFEDAAQIILADPVRRFDWRPERGGGSAVGWGAQTSHAVSPDLATPGGWVDPVTEEPSEEGVVRWIDPLTGAACDERDVFLGPDGEPVAA